MFACWSVGSRRSSDQSDANVTVCLSKEANNTKVMHSYMQIFHHKHTGKRMLADKKSCKQRRQANVARFREYERLIYSNIALVCQQNGGSFSSSRLRLSGLSNL